MKKRKLITDWFSFIAPRIVLTTILAGIITRIVLICCTDTTGFALLDWPRIFLLGLVNDVAFAAIALLPAFLVYSMMNQWKYKRPQGYIIFALLLLQMVYVLCFNDITDEYGGVVPRITNVLVTLVFLLFSLLLFVPKSRNAYRRTFILLTTFLYAFLLTANIVSEQTFWDEFGVRYNFIAVDYLVYTNEVVGNILESYNMPLLVGGALLAGLLVHFLMTLGADTRRAGVKSLGRWLTNLAAVATLSVAGGCWLHYSYRNHVSDNAFVTELQENGCWNFLEAFNSSELDYNEFYTTLPADEAQALQRELCQQNADGIHPVTAEDEPLLKNIVLIMVESLSAEFMERYGSTDAITPNLDSLARQSLVFDNLFAAGNRSVRGLEAVTLCIPPGAGESIVKRPDNGGRFSTAQVLQSYGYKTRFVYGGDSYFDNMRNFFSAYGYDITDRASYAPEEVTFANIWGTCDEDSYNVALRLCDADHQAGQPFFTHIMTISNHRPFTYPEGKIQYEGKATSRRAAVKYTDHAIGQFLREAAQKPWFRETVFLIVADHCASSAGKTNIPVGRYHIPAILHAPGFIQPLAVGKLCSQIDLMPTLFSLLHLSYDSRFYGQDILAPTFRERAYMATYQNLGYYADGILTVLSPVRRVEQFAVTPAHDGTFLEEELTAPTPASQSLLRQAQALYQTSAHQ